MKTLTSKDHLNQPSKSEKIIYENKIININIFTHININMKFLEEGIKWLFNK